MPHERPNGNSAQTVKQRDRRHEPKREDCQADRAGRVARTTSRVGTTRDRRRARRTNLARRAARGSKRAREVTRNVNPRRLATNDGVRSHQTEVDRDQDQQSKNSALRDHSDGDMTKNPTRSPEDPPDAMGDDEHRPGAPTESPDKAEGARGRGGEVRAIYVPLLVGIRVSCVRARSRRIVSDTIRLL